MAPGHGDGRCLGSGLRDGIVARGPPGQEGGHESRDDLPPNCPVCGEQMVRILYGFPMPGAWDLVGRGEAVLGGCVVDPDNSRWSCKDKHASAGTLEDISGDH